jgi:hypothetical protein
LFRTPQVPSKLRFGRVCAPLAINKPFEVFELIEQVRAALGEQPADGP